jgi:hypothetical protein
MGEKLELHNGTKMVKKSINPKVFLLNRMKLSLPRIMRQDQLLAILHHKYLLFKIRKLAP